MNAIKIICRALITDEENRVLIVKKTDSDFWSLPGGKMDDTDVGLLSCLTRELQEEIGVKKISNENIFLVQEFHKNNTRYIELIWTAKIVDDIFVIPKNIQKVSHGELSDIQWIKKEKLCDINIKPEFLKNLTPLSPQ